MKCALCGGKIKSVQPRAKFCSAACREAVRRAKYVKATIGADIRIRFCAVCHFPISGRHANARTCSYECHREQQRSLGDRYRAVRIAAFQTVRDLTGNTFGGASNDADR